MARKALINKANAKPKYSTRTINRCQLCGRRHAYMRRYKMCRLCFREYATRGLIPGVKKASW